MVYAVFGLSVLLLMLVFRLVILLRLGLPLIYALLVPVLFPDWYHRHMLLADGLFFVMVGLVALSWVITLLRRIWG